ncbi:MAG: hemerythrin domain-containing protein [Phycisphaerae bacterium]
MKVQTAAWMRDEHRVTRELIGEVTRVVGRASSANMPEWLDELRYYFSRLRAHLKKHMKAEEAGGYLEPVLELRPTLSPEVDRLKGEHIELALSLDQICDELERLEPDDKPSITDTCHRIQHLISAVRHHENREELLVTYAFNQDLGGHD